MSTSRPAASRNYRALLVAALVSGGNLLPLLPAFADQNSPTPGTPIENQATAQFDDAADTGVVGATPVTILSDKVSVTVAEVAGISATNSGIVNTAYRTNTVFFDFIVKNEGNDPTQLFVPGTPSAATLNGVAIPAGNIGTLTVIEYNNTVTTTTISANNTLAAAGTATGTTTAGGNLTGVPNGGSVPAGGFIKVRVPITIPATAVTGQTISVTLGNTAGQASATNTPYIVGANGTGGNDLYTQDNADGAGAPAGTTTIEAAGTPVNGDRTPAQTTDGRRQEASATQTTPVVNPPNVTISGTVWDDADGSGDNGGAGTFGTIQNGAEAGAVTTATSATTPLRAVLVSSAGTVLDIQPVNATNGTYSVSTLGVQNGLYVVLTTNTETIGQPLSATAPTLPANWTAVTPLTYSGANAFSVGITNVTGKDFGIELLPDTAAANQSGIANPPGNTKYQVPTLNGTDTDPTATAITSFKIVSIPNAAQGVLSYNTGTIASPIYTPVTAGQVITSYDATKLVFDPVDGVVNMSFTYASIDGAGKEDPTPATVTMSFNATPVTLTGKVYNDRNGTTAGTSNNGTTIAANPAGTDPGTNAVFGTTQTAVNAVLVDATTGNAIQASVPVAADGTYTFSNVPPSTNVRVVLSATPVASGATPSATAAITGWVATAPRTTATINTGLFPVTSATNDIDFGIRQRAKLVLLKRITKINGATTNANDGTVLTGVMTTDTFNNVGNWPANYVVGANTAGAVKPGDTIEYTIYFLNNQGSDANNVKICDPIRGSQDFQANSISLTLGGGSATALPDTNTYAGTIPTDCNAAGSTSAGAANGGVRIPLSSAVVGATGIGAPAASYGKFSFTTKVKP